MLDAAVLDEPVDTVDLDRPEAPTPAPAPGAGLPPAPARTPRGRPKKRRHHRLPRVDRPVLTPRTSYIERPDGSIDFERTSPEALRKLAAAVQQPEARTRLGLDAALESAAAARASWDKTAPQLVSIVNALALQYWAQPQFSLTDEEAKLFVLQRNPDAHQQVSGSVAWSLNKFLPEGIGEYDQLLTGAVALTAFLGESVAQLRALRAARAVPAPVIPFPDASE